MGKGSQRQNKNGSIGAVRIPIDSSGRQILVIRGAQLSTENIESLSNSIEYWLTKTDLAVYILSIGNAELELVRVTKRGARAREEDSKDADLGDKGETE